MEKKEYSKTNNSIIKISHVLKKLQKGSTITRNMWWMNHSTSCTYGVLPYDAPSAFFVIWRRKCIHQKAMIHLVFHLARSKSISQHAFAIITYWAVLIFPCHKDWLVSFANIKPMCVWCVGSLSFASYQVNDVSRAPVLLSRLFGLSMHEYWISELSNEKKKQRG